MGIKLARESGMYEAHYRGSLIGEYVAYRNAADAHDYLACIREGYNAQTIFPENKNIFILNLERMGYPKTASGGFKVGE